MVTRILIVDDGANGHRCAAMRRFLEKSKIQYDVATTLEQANCKMFHTEEAPYDAVILDRSFPIRAGEKETGTAGESFLSSMQEHKMEIPVLIHSTMTSIPKSDLVVDRMSPWEHKKLERFLKNLIGEKLI